MLGLFAPLELLGFAGWQVRQGFQYFQVFRQVMFGQPLFEEEGDPLFQRQVRITCAQGHIDAETLDNL